MRFALAILLVFVGHALAQSPQNLPRQWRGPPYPASNSITHVSVAITPDTFQSWGVPLEDIFGATAQGIPFLLYGETNEFTGVGKVLTAGSGITLTTNGIELLIASTGGGGGSASNLLYVSTIADLASTATPANYDLAIVAGYFSEGDGGGGVFFPTNTATGTNFGTRIDSVTADYSWERLRDAGPLNLRWFGALGVTNQVAYPMITNALQVATVSPVGTGYNSPRGAALFVPDGIYRVNTVVDCPDGVRIVGQSRHGTIFDNTGTTNDVFYLDKATTGGMNPQFQFENFTIHGTNSQVAVTAGAGIHVSTNNNPTSTYGGVIKNVHVHGGIYNGIVLEGAVTVHLDSVRVQVASSHGFLLRPYAGNIVLDNCFAILNLGDGFKLDGAATGITFNSCASDQNEGSGFNLIGSVGVTFNGCVAERNRQDNFTLTSTDGVDMQVYSLVGVTSGLAPRDGIRIDGGKSVTIRDSRTDTDGTAGIGYAINVTNAVGSYPEMVRIVGGRHAALTAGILNDPGSVVSHHTNNVIRTRQVTANGTAPQYTSTAPSETSYSMLRIANAAGLRRLDLFYNGTGAAAAYNFPLGGAGINSITNLSFGAGDDEQFRIYTTDSGYFFGTLTNGAQVVIGESHVGGPMFVTNSLQIPTGAAPTVNAVGEIAVDNNLWAASRGSLIYYDGTAAVAAVGALVSDTPGNGQVPKWNTGGTITWEDDNSAAPASGDAAYVNETAASDSFSLTNSAASSTLASITWSISSGTDPDPDRVSVAIGPASATDAGIVTAGTQTISGDKTFSGAVEVGGALTKSGTAVSVVGHAHAGEDITSGTVADARIDAAIARDAEVAAAYQPLDADLTDLADGSLSGSKVGTGIDAANLTTGTLSTNRYTRVGVFRTIWIDAGAMVSRTTSGAAAATEEYATNDRMSDHYLFDGTTSEAVQFRLSMPDEWDLSTVKVKVYWDAATAGSGAVVWGVKAAALSNDDAIDGAWGSEVNVTDTVIAVGDLHVSPATAAVTVGGTPALEDLIWFEIDRNPADGSDTMSQDAKLLGVMIQYHELTTEPAAW